MNEFEEKVKKFISRHELIQKGSSILVGVSGGPDSLALLYFLKKHIEYYDISISVAHMDHMLRGKQSYEELLYVKSICQEWNIPFESIQVNVYEKSKEKYGSTEAIARELRYDFFQSVMEKNNIPNLALGHHGDDQIETILMRLTRGSELKATAGIQVKRPFASGTIIRPFLCVTKAEIENYIRRNNLKPVYDHTNQLDIYTRNRFRNHVLPFLKSENKNVHIHFQQFSEQMLEDEKFLMDLAKETYNKVINKECNGDLSVNLIELKKAPFPLQRRCIQLILNYLYKSKLPKDLTSIHIESILEMVDKNKPSGRIDLPQKLKVYRSYDFCIFTYREQTKEPYFYKWYKGESIDLPNGRQLVFKEGIVPNTYGPDIFILDKKTKFPLYVRTRKNGDRIRIKGVGTKKIKSLFIDLKIPKQDRDKWPIVTDQDDNILWVPGLKKSIYEASDLKKGSTTFLQYE